MDPTIRPAIVADCEDIASLVERYWQFEQIEGFERGRIVQLLQWFISRPERSRCWIAEQNGALCGYLFDGTIAEIDELLG